MSESPKMLVRLPARAQRQERVNALREKLHEAKRAHAEALERDDERQEIRAQALALGQAPPELTDAGVAAAEREVATLERALELAERDAARQREAGPADATLAELAARGIEAIARFRSASSEYVAAVEALEAVQAQIARAGGRVSSWPVLREISGEVALLATAKSLEPQRWTIDLKEESGNG